MKKSEIKNSRNYGIDLLRIVSMFMIIVLHSLGKGGVLNAKALSGNQLYVSWFLETFCYVSVDIFVLICGFVNYKDEDKPLKISNYLKIWLQVVFYGLVVNLVFDIFNLSFVRSSDYFKVLMPVSKKLYWYITAYTGLFFLIPILNSAVRGLDKKKAIKIVVILIILFSFYDNMFGVFLQNKGYSLIWLIILYLIGAIMKKFDLFSKLKKRYCFLIIFVLCFITFAIRVWGVNITIDYVKINFNHKMILSYISPTILFSAMLYVSAFSKMKFGKIINKIIGFFAPSALAIYLLNNHYLIWNHFMANRFAYLVGTRALKIIFVVLTFSFIFCLVSLLIDKVREIIFKILRINKLLKKIDEKIKL